MKNHFISVVLPTYNEATNIVEMIQRCYCAITDKGYAGEIIVVDDDSPDKTWEIAGQIKKKYVKVFRRENRKGLASAINFGIQNSKGDIVVWMDADLSMPPEMIPTLIKDIINQNADVCVGSRYAVGGKDARTFFRVFTSRSINLFANIVLNFKVQDYDSGFIAIRKKILKRVQIPNSNYGEYCIEFLYNCQRKNFKINEIGYIFSDRISGESKSGNFFGLLRNGLNYLMHIIKIRFQN
jgi:dolichol-phosphate mannosyltransferase